MDSFKSSLHDHVIAYPETPVDFRPQASLTFPLAISLGYGQQHVYLLLNFEAVAYDDFEVPLRVRRMLAGSDVAQERILG
jgi:hypothetical protein